MSDGITEFKRELAEMSGGEDKDKKPRPATPPKMISVPLVEGTLISETMGKLNQALSKAQLEMASAHKNEENPFFKSSFANLESVVTATRPSLNKHGLCLSQDPVVDSQTQSVWLISHLGHVSGEQKIVTSCYKPKQFDIHSVGSAISYLRRYSWSSICGCPQGIPDDDGNLVKGEK